MSARRAPNSRLYSRADRDDEVETAMRGQRQIEEWLALRAAEWLETLKTPREAERTAFVSWLSESRLHVQEFLEAVAVDEALGNVRPELRQDLDALVSRVGPGA